MKKAFLLLLVICTVLTSLLGCSDDKCTDVDLSALDFVNVEWERNTDYCLEKIYFNDDGSCGYYCTCGNPVNDDDLCDGYTYDPESKTIHLDFFETTSETVTDIIVKSCDENTLVLDFDGDIRTFVRTEDDDEDYFDYEIEYNGNIYTYLETPADIFYYDLRECEDHEEDDYLPIAHDKWDLVYHNTDLFILSSQADEAIAYYSDKQNYTWSVVIEDKECEIPTTVPIEVSAEDCDYIYTMEDCEWEMTLSFDDIELFGTLVKTSKDSLIEGRTSLAYYDGCWYWRSEIIDDTAEGWPEYVVPIPETVSVQFEHMT